MAFRFFNPAEKVTVTQGHLPHWDQESATYFITWRTADSIPKEIWKRWLEERDAWLAAQGINEAGKDWRQGLERLPEATRSDFRRFGRALERELDVCHGECLLKKAEIAGVVVEALRFFDGTRYQLGDFIVMPNHVHVLVSGLDQQAMQQQVESWKKWTGRKINEVLGRRGRFWQAESFDHLVRNQGSFEKLRGYIAHNPKAAGLAEGQYVHWRRED